MILPDYTDKKAVRDFTEKFILSSEEFDKLLHEFVDLDKGYTSSNKTKTIIPKIYVVGVKKEGKHPVAILAIADNSFNDSKHALFYKSGEKVVEMGLSVCAAFMSSEAWVVTGIDSNSQEAQDFLSGKKRPSESKRKQEVLVTCGLRFDMASNSACTQMHRTPDEYIMLGETKFIEYNNATDDFSVMPNGLLVEFFKGYSYGHRKTKNTTTSGSSNSKESV